MRSTTIPKETTEWAHKPATDRILDIVRKVRQLAFAEQDMIHAMTHGSCFRFADLMRTIDSKISLYNNQDHVICRLSGVFFDIRGKLTVEFIDGITGAVHIDEDEMTYYPLPASEEYMFADTKHVNI